jgi:hypothetical protein
MATADSTKRRTTTTAKLRRQRPGDVGIDDAHM